MDLTQAILNKIAAMIADKPGIAIKDPEAVAVVEALQELRDWIVAEKKELEKKLEEEKEKVQEFMVHGTAHYLDKTLRAPVQDGVTIVVEADSESEAREKYKGRVKQIEAMTPRKDKEFTRVTIEKVTKLGEEY